MASAGVSHGNKCLNMTLSPRGAAQGHPNTLLKRMNLPNRDALAMQGQAQRVKSEEHRLSGIRKQCFVTEARRLHAGQGLSRVDGYPLVAVSYPASGGGSRWQRRQDHGSD